MTQVEQVLERYGLKINGDFEQKMIEKMALPKLRIEITDEPLHSEIRKKILTAFLVSSPRISVGNKETFDRVFNTSVMHIKIPDCMWKIVRLSPYRSVGANHYYFTDISTLNRIKYIQDQLASPDANLVRFLKEQRFRNAFSKKHEAVTTFEFLEEQLTRCTDELTRSPVLETFTNEMAENLIEQFRHNCVFAKQT